jgi:phosphoesterase RecJ-like protein
MYEKAIQQINEAKKIVIIQPENPDGDSLGSALALEEILSEAGKEVSLYCDVDMPKYLRYFSGWDRVTQELDTNADMAIIVDTSSDTLIGKLYNIPGSRHFLETRPTLVIDHHHEMNSTLSFPHDLLLEEVVATGQMIYNLASTAGWKINEHAAECLLGSMLSDSLGFTTEGVNDQTFSVAAELLKLGASPSKLEKRRREFMKKSPEILAYKGELINRIEYYLDGKLALVHIPWDDIKEYSDQYNPSVLVLDEMRLVEGVEIGVAIKTYPDGKLTGKLRSNSPISGAVAAYFGGGGHKYAAGFRIYEEYDKTVRELLDAVDKSLKDYYADQTV